MRWLLLRWIANAVALFVTVQLVPGIRFDGTLGNLAALAALFGVLNTLLRPLILLLTCPLVLLTFGLFALAFNGILLWMLASLSDRWQLGLHVDGWFAAFLGGLMIGLVSVLVGTLVHGDRHEDGE